MKKTASVEKLIKLANKLDTKYQLLKVADDEPNAEDIRPQIESTVKNNLLGAARELRMSNFIEMLRIDNAEISFSVTINNNNPSLFKKWFVGYNPQQRLIEVSDISVKINNIEKDTPENRSKYLRLKNEFKNILSKVDLFPKVVFKDFVVNLSFDGSEG